jgi:transcriptional regulator NrdR family protein
MQKCKHCGSRRTNVQDVRDPETHEIIGSRTVCTRCQNVIHEHIRTKPEDR